MRRTLPAVSLLLCVVLCASGCGRAKSNSDNKSPTPQAVGVKGDSKQAAADLGFPLFATKNTTRVAGADPIADAAAVARAVYSGGSPQARPRAVALADAKDWRATLVAAALMSPPIRAPLLLSDGPTNLPDATTSALDALKPTGSKAAGNAQIVRVGAVPQPAGYKSTDVRAKDPAALARAVDAFVSAASGRTTDHVLVVSADAPQFALPAAAWAAKSGDPILFVNKNALPADTKAAIVAHQSPKIYVLGPSSVIAPAVTKQLRKLGKVTRVGGQTPAANAIAFARFVDGSFGFGIVDPGHGLVFAPVNADPATAAAVAPLSSSGSYGPLLLLENANTPSKELAQYLLDIQPGYAKDPVRGVYNRAWIVGDERAVSAQLQSTIDRYLEIVPVSQHLQQQP
jgi:putative cell wall-binding protein